MLPFIRLHVRSLGHVDNLAFAGKDVRPQMQVVVLVTSVVQQNVAVRTLRGTDVCFMIVRVELLGEMNELTAVARILKQYDVLRIQSYRLHMWVFIEKKFCTMNITETFLRCDPRVNILVSLSSASSVRSS